MTELASEPQSELLKLLKFSASPTSTSTWPTLTKLEELLMTEEDKVSDEILNQITLQPIPLEDYSVVDNIYRCSILTAADLLQTLRTIHRELVENAMDSNASNASYSTQSGDISCLPRELLPLIVDYGHGEYFIETIEPSSATATASGGEGKTIKRFVEDAKGNLIEHGPQTVTYPGNGKLSADRYLIIYGKRVVQETVVKKIMDSDVNFATYSINFAWGGHNGHGYLGYLHFNPAERTGFGSIHFSELNSNQSARIDRPFQIIRQPSIPPVSKFHLVNLDLVCTESK